MTTQQIAHKTVIIQLLGQLLLEELESIHGVELIWKQDGKRFGNLAINAGEIFIKRIGDKIPAAQSQDYVDASKIIRDGIHSIIPESHPPENA